MDFSNSFSVAARLEEVWDFMLNVEEVTPCVPGAEVTETLDDTHYRGVLRVKLGPVSLSYRGDIEVERDRDEGRIVLHATGTEVRGVGRASAVISTVLSAAEVGTEVQIDSHVDVTGRVAQFGRGIMQDVASRNISEFASCLQEKIGAASA
jgi:uncharacterized protein